MQTAWKPAPGQVALIELDEDRELCLTGVVMGADEGPVVINLGASPSPPAAPCQVVASFFSPDALYRVKGIAAPHGTQQAVIGLTMNEIERVQRRSVPRARVSLPVTLSSFDDPGDLSSVRGETVDLGPGGCRVRCKAAFPSGADPTVTLELPDGTTVSALAQVLQASRDNGSHEYRLAFMELEDGDADRLTALVTDT